MENSICKILGNNIKRYRKAKNFKQEELAEMIGLEIKSLSLIETGKGFVSAKTLEKLSSVLKISVAELFEVADSENSEKLYNAILENLQSIRQNSEKLKTLYTVLKSLM